MGRNPISRSAQLRAGFRHGLRAPLPPRAKHVATSVGFVAGPAAALALILLFGR